MSSLYTPAPSKLVGITRPSDGDNLTASSVNPALEDLADGCAWLEREIRLQVSKLSARNFLASDYSKAARDPFSTTDEASFAFTSIHGLGADADSFWCTIRDTVLDLDTSYLVKTRDGISWRRKAVIPLAATLQHRAIASRGDGWIALGCASMATSSGQNIDIINPAGVLSQTARSFLGTFTNWRCGVFAGTRCFMFGGRQALNGAMPGGNYARVGSASLAGSFLDWDEPTGGILGGELVDVNDWVCCTKVVAGTPIVLAVPRSSYSKASYLYVNATANTVTQQAFTSPSTDEPAGVVAWKDRFWMARSGAGGGTDVFTRLFVSDDGIAWTLASTVPGFYASALIAEGSALVLFEYFNSADYPNATRSFTSTDGVTWEQTGLSSLYDFATVVASTGKRSAIMRRPQTRWVTEHDNLRVSLGGL